MTYLKRQRFNSNRLHPLHLLLIEILKLVHGKVPIPIQIHTPEPILDGGRVRLVLLAQQEPYEFRVGHPLIVGVLPLAARHAPAEDSIDDANGES